MQEHDLIRTPFEVIYLGGADFSGADLKAANLTNTNLISVNFSGADRRGASFSAFQGTGEDILRASSEGVRTSL